MISVRGAAIAATDDLLDPNHAESELSVIPSMSIPGSLRSIWTVLRLKERLVKLLMEHSHLHAATQHNGANQVQIYA